MPFRHLLNEYATFSIRGKPKEIYLVRKIFLKSSKVLHTLLASIGPDNKVSLEATFDPDPLYSLTPRQIVDAMFAEHGTTDPQDLAVLRAPLHEPLPALAHLECHMNLFLLASKKLTTAGQGKTPYEYVIY